MIERAENPLAGSRFVLGIPSCSDEDIQVSIPDIHPDPIHLPDLFSRLRTIQASYQKRWRTLYGCGPFADRVHRRTGRYVCHILNCNANCVTIKQK